MGLLDYLPGMVFGCSICVDSRARADLGFLPLPLFTTGAAADAELVAAAVIGLSITLSGDWSEW